MDNYKLTKLQIKLIDWIGSYLIRKKQKKVQFNLIKELIYFYLKKTAYTLPYGRFTEGERYISQRFFGFNVGMYSYRYQQFWKEDTLIESIGAYCSFAINITVVGGNHPINLVSSHPFLFDKEYGCIHQSKDILNQKITIGNDVWIGANVTLLPGISIGDGAIIGAGAVVSKSVPPYAVVVGVPAKVIRYRFESDIIDGMMESKWWTWDEERIKRATPLMDDPKNFLQSIKSGAI